MLKEKITREEVLICFFTSQTPTDCTASTVCVSPMSGSSSVPFIIFTASQCLYDQEAEARCGMDGMGCG